MIAKTDRDIENEDFAHSTNAGLIGLGIEVVADKDDRFTVLIKGLDRRDMLSLVCMYMKQRKR